MQLSNEARALADTRRRFMTHFAGIGLGATLAPGVLWARMQDQGTQRITLEMVTDALKLAGIEATETERQGMVNGANQALARYEAVRQMDIPNDVSPPFHFSAIVPGIDVSRAKHPFRLSAAPETDRASRLSPRPTSRLRGSPCKRRGALRVPNPDKFGRLLVRAALLRLPLGRQSRLTSPMACASAAGTGRPVRTSSMARD